jgi:hypothetical protein
MMALRSSGPTRASEAVVDCLNERIGRDRLAEYAGEIVNLGAACDHDDRDVARGRRRRKLLVNGAPADGGQVEIEHHEIRRVLLNQVQRDERVRCLLDLETCQLQCHAEVSTKVSIIIDDQNALPHSEKF